MKAQGVYRLHVNPSCQQRSDTVDRRDTGLITMWEIWNLYASEAERAAWVCGVQSVVSGLVVVNEVRPCIKTQKVKKKSFRPRTLQVWQLKN